MPAGGAAIDQGVVRAVGQAVAVLHRGDRARRRARSNSSTVTLEMPMWRTLPARTSSAMAPTDSSIGVSSSTQWSCSRSIDLAPQLLEAGLADGADRLGAAVAVHDAGADLGDAALGGDHEAVGIGVQRLGDQRLVEAGAVGMGGVDQGHAELDRAAQDADACVGVAVGSPVAGLAGQAHGAVAEPGDLSSPPMRKVPASRAVMAIGCPSGGAGCSLPRAAGGVDGGVGR